MKTTLSFGLVIAAAGTLFACSSDEGTPRPIGGAGTPGAGVGGSGGGAGPATGAGGSAGAPVTGGGGSAGAPSTLTKGPALTISEDATVADASGNSDINGLAQLVSSPLNPEETFAPRAGALCMSGSVGPVPGTDYDNYWGAEIDLDLKLGANPAAGDAGAAVGDAGDAGGVLGLVPQSWSPTPGNVIGFSFKIEGATVPASIRFKTAPWGSDPAVDNFCNAMSPVSGATQEILFTNMTRDCWVGTNPAVFDDPAGYTGLQNIGWQVNADPGIAYAFDFCISDIQPILAP
jgi:hypothetical protein